MTTIPFDSVAGFLVTFVGRIDIGMYSRAFTIPQVGMNIRAHIKLGCGAILIRPALLVVTNTDGLEFGENTMHCATRNSGVLLLSSCRYSVWI